MQSLDVRHKGNGCRLAPPLRNPSWRTQVMANARSAPSGPNRGRSCLFRRSGIPERNQLGKYLLLLRDPVRRPGLISRTGVSRGLLDQVDYVLPDHGDALLEL